MQVISQIFQIVIALGLLNVWLLRFNKATQYRGGQASSMRQEFATYGLPEWFCYLVGFLKVTSAFCLLVGLFIPSIVIYPTVVVCVLMVGALAMHLKVKDPIKKSIPALGVLLMALTILFSIFNS